MIIDRIELIHKSYDDEINATFVDGVGPRGAIVTWEPMKVIDNFGHDQLTEVNSVTSMYIQINKTFGLFGVYYILFSIGVLYFTNCFNGKHWSKMCKPTNKQYICI